MVYVLLPPLETLDVPEGEMVPPEPAEAEMLNDPTEPDWVTVKAWPPTVRIAVLDALPVLAATANETDPGPVPLDPADTVSHEAPLTAVQLQVDPAETDTLPAPPEETYDWLTGEREKLHEAGAL
jgi:hypothetical protein